MSLDHKAGTSPSGLVALMQHLCSY